MALGLSMRTLMDLKAAIFVHHEHKDGECAVDVSVKMLRNAIDESDIMFWASDQLLNRIIRRDSDGKWILDLTGNPVGKFKQTSQYNQIFIPSEKYTLQSV